MKQLLAIVSLIACAAIARAADVKVKAYMTDNPEDDAMTSFAPDTSKLYAIFQTNGIQNGDKVRGVLVAEDVGKRAPPNTNVMEKTLSLDEDTDDGDFNFSKPDKGWPMGKYRVEIYVNSDLAAKAKFTIEAEEKSESKESTGLPDETELKSMTDAAIGSFGRAIKKKDFSAFYKQTASVWQEQTSPKKLLEAFGDFLDKDIDLAGAIKDKEPVFNHPAAIGSDGVLLVQGYYPTKPNRIVFQLKYLKDEGEWRLVGVNVNLKE